MAGFVPNSPHGYLQLLLSLALEVTSVCVIVCVFGGLCFLSSMSPWHDSDKSAGATLCFKLHYRFLPIAPIPPFSPPSLHPPLSLMLPHALLFYSLHTVLPLRGPSPPFISWSVLSGSSLHFFPSLISVIIFSASKLESM